MVKNKKAYVPLYVTHHMHSKTENKHHVQELTTVSFIFNVIALKTLEQSMLLVHDILRY